MKCPNCGEDVKPTDKQCPNCHFDLEKFRNEFFTGQDTTRNEKMMIIRNKKHVLLRKLSQRNRILPLRL